MGIFATLQVVSCRVVSCGCWSLLGFLDKGKKRKRETKKDDDRGGPKSKREQKKPECESGKAGKGENGKRDKRN